MNDYEAQVKALDAEITEKSNEMDRLIVLWVEETCPVKIGDTVEDVGYGLREKKGIVTKLWGKIDRWGKQPGALVWKVSGKRLKNDGEESKFGFEFDRFEWDRSQARLSEKK